MVFLLRRAAPRPGRPPLAGAAEAGREREAPRRIIRLPRGTLPKARGWKRWFWNLFLILCQGWGVFFLGAVTLRIHRTGLAGFWPMMLLTALGAAAVLAGWSFYGTGRQRTAGLVWTGLAVAGAGLVTAIGSPHNAEFDLIIFGTTALSGALAMAGSQRGAKPALAGAVAFGIVVALGAGRDWAAGRLSRAVRSRDLAAVRNLVASGAKVDREEAEGVTPLMGAVAAGDPEMARVLIAGGASAYTRDARGRSAMMRALARDDDALAVALLLAERERTDRQAGGGGGRK